MKRFSIPLVAGVSSCLISCGDMNQPLGGEFNPLMTPGSAQVADNSTGNYNFSAGQYVTAASNSTAFFSKKPEGNADADELLAAGTSMRVVKSEGSFIKVELDNGKVGYVAAALLLESQQGAAGEVQVFPPMSGEAELPLPTGTVPDDLSPSVTPTDLDTGAPLPPIAPPTVGELPPPAADETKKPESTPLPEPATGN
jgi:hypothetical protein